MDLLEWAEVAQLEEKGGGENETYLVVSFLLEEIGFEIYLYEDEIGYLCDEEWRIWEAPDFDTEASLLSSFLADLWQEMNRLLEQRQCVAESESSVTALTATNPGLMMTISGVIGDCAFSRCGIYFDEAKRALVVPFEKWIPANRIVEWQLGPLKRVRTPSYCGLVRVENVESWVLQASGGESIYRSNRVDWNPGARSVSVVAIGEFCLIATVSQLSVTAQLEKAILHSESKYTFFDWRRGRNRSPAPR